MPLLDLTHTREFREFQERSSSLEIEVLSWKETYTHKWQGKDDEKRHRHLDHSLTDNVLSLLCFRFLATSFLFLLSCPWPCDSLYTCPALPGSRRCCRCHSARAVAPPTRVGKALYNPFSHVAPVKMVNGIPFKQSAYLRPNLYRERKSFFLSFLRKANSEP